MSYPSFLRVWALLWTSAHSDPKLHFSYTYILIFFNLRKETQVSSPSDLEMVLMIHLIQAAHQKHIFLSSSLLASLRQNSNSAKKKPFSCSSRREVVNWVSVVQ